MEAAVPDLAKGRRTHEGHPGLWLSHLWCISNIFVDVTLIDGAKWSMGTGVFSTLLRCLVYLAIACRVLPF